MEVHEKLLIHQWKSNGISKRYKIRNKDKAMTKEGENQWDGIDIQKKNHSLKPKI